jgi:putative ABC transport system permease protein
MNVDMWRSAIKNLLKNRAFTAVSLLGLVVGFVGCMIVALFIRYEFSWDKVHQEYDRIYRVQRYYTKVAYAHDGSDISPHTHARTASLLEVHPEFEKVTVLREEGGKFLSTSLDNQVYEEAGIIADQNFPQVFTLKFVQGNSYQSLYEPFTMLLSKSLAKILFPEEEAVGKNVIYEKKLDFKVTGVYEDYPKNSSIRPAYIISFSTLKTTDNIVRDESWSGNMMTYALLQKGVTEGGAETKIKNAYAEFQGRELEELELCPLSKIYLSFNGRNDYYIMLFIFGIIGLFILVMSALNYVNFTVATATTRGKEIAVRKISGAGRSELIAQIQGETVLLAFIASLVALVAASYLLPLFNTFVHADLELSFIRDWKVMLILVMVSLLIGFFSGMYPARVISSPNVAKLIKGGAFSGKGSRFDIKKVLVTLQFTISIFLICLTLFFILQIRHMSAMDLGFDRSGLLYIKLSTDQSRGDFEPFRNRLIQHPEILNVSMSTTLPFVNMSGGMLNWEGGDPDDKIFYRGNWVSYDFIKNMGVEIRLGRDFSPQFPADKNRSCIINEAALRCFDWKDPIGKKINDNKWTIVGVMEDYHLSDIHNQIDPAVLLLSDGQMQGDLTFAIRISGEHMEKVTAILNSEFQSLFPSDPFEINNIQTAITNENSFKIYQTIKKSVSFFSFFTILLAIIALLSMVSYSLSRRTKEIGIRKINGSSVRNLFLMLNRDYFLLLGISLGIALPLVYLAYSALPGNFKIALPVCVPFIAALVILLIILVTTGFQTLKAARRNPVEALRYE